jgi:hypothetical protein
MPPTPVKPRVSARRDAVNRALTHHGITHNAPLPRGRNVWVVYAEARHPLVLTLRETELYCMGLADKERQFHRVLNDPTSIIPNDLLDPERMRARTS